MAALSKEVSRAKGGGSHETESLEDKSGARATNDSRKELPREKRLKGERRRDSVDENETLERGK